MFNKRAVKQSQLILRARKEVLRLEKSINKGPFKDIKESNLALWNRTSGIVDSLLDTSNQLVTGESWVNNISDLPNAAKHKNKIIYVLNFGKGGSPWISNGTIWVPASGRIVVERFHEPFTLTTNVTTLQIMRQALFPFHSNVGGNVIRVGDIVRLSLDLRKTGVVNTYTRYVKVGVTGTVSDGQPDLFGATAASFACSVERHYYVRLAGNVIQKIGMFGSVSIQGTTSGSVGGNITIGSGGIDSNNIYFSSVGNMDGSTDTLKQRTFMAELFVSGVSS